MAARRWEDEDFCYLTTRGRRTGRPHMIEIWFGASDTGVFMLSGGGRRADWVRNLQADPSVKVRVGSRTYTGTARLVEDPDEDARARRLLAAKYQSWREGKPLSRWASTALLVAIDLQGGTLSDGGAIYTIGHGARSLEEFLAVLHETGIERLVDVRTAPSSRKHPQFGKDALANSLENAGIQYVWRKDLGGWRRPRPDSRHTALRSAGFRGYADHMDSAEFREVREWLIRTSAETPTAVMCAESLWWRCHRSMLSDGLVAAGAEVRHIMRGGRVDQHRLHSTARIVDDLPVYDRATGRGGPQES